MANEPKEQSKKTNPLLERLKPFVGEWEVEISAMAFRANKAQTVPGFVSFNWLADGAFIVVKSEFSDSEFPSGTEVIGLDDTNEKYGLLYSDERGVFRLYEMSLHEDEWKIWRTAPGFSQRFTGLFSTDNNTIKAHWESSKDSLTWEQDFDLTYKRKPGEQ